MQITFFVPTYWARPSTHGHRDGDRIFDHPTSLDAPGTLARTLESFARLYDQTWSLLIGIATTTDAITSDAYARVRDAIGKLPAAMQERTAMFGEREAAQLRDFLAEESVPLDPALSSFTGYPGIRNLGLLAGILAGADVLVMVDDDQVFEDFDFVRKVREAADAVLGGKELVAWSGYCPEQTGVFRVRPYEPWMRYWDKIGAQNEAYQALITVPEPRLKVTPLAFGGCLVLKRSVFRGLPFDPYVGRGEDMDYLMNARMAGIPFYLDSQLFMLHLPPPRSHPQWQRIREDMVRYLYQREKLRNQIELPGTVRVTLDAFMPYPGRFLGEDLDERIVAANTALAAWYRERGDARGAEEAMRTIQIAQHTRSPHDPFRKFMQLREHWESVCRTLDRERDRLWAQLRAGS